VKEMTGFDGLQKTARYVKPKTKRTRRIKKAKQRTDKMP
jgi:hypothetical protein